MRNLVLLATFLCMTVGAIAAPTSSLKPVPNQPANVITVAKSGGDYTTVQAAVDAASAGASNTNRITVLVHPGVKRDYTAADNVDVVFVDLLGSRSGGFYPANEPELEQYQLNYPGGLIAIRLDDDNDDWLDDSATFGGTNPIAYAAALGIVCTHGIIPNTIDTATHFTSDDLVTLTRTYGNSLECHSNQHETTPSTHAQAVAAITGAREALENFTVDGYSSPGESLGVLPQVFIQPGNWENEGYINSRSDVDDWIAQVIRASFPASEAYAHGQYAGGLPPRHFMGYGNPGDLSTAGNALATVLALAQPGMRTLFVLHNPDETFKNLVDAIVAVRDDRSTYPTKVVHSVTCRALHAGLQPGAYYDASGVIQIPSPHGYWEDFEGWTSGAITVPCQDFRCYVGGASASIETGGTYGQFLRINAAASANAIYRANFTLRAGRQYRVQFYAKSTGAASFNLRPICYCFSGDTPSAITQPNRAISVTSDWVLKSALFDVPTFSDGHGYIEFNVWGGAGGVQMDFDQVSIEAL